MYNVFSSVFDSAKKQDITKNSQFQTLLDKMRHVNCVKPMGNTNDNF